MQFEIQAFHCNFQLHLSMTFSVYRANGIKFYLFNNALIAVMKGISLCLFFCFIFFFSYCQDKGSVTSTEIMPKAGMVELYRYHPSKHLKVPERIYASVVYNYRDYYYNKVIPIQKEKSGFQFLFKAPDSTQALVFSIIDDKKMTVENNDSGFTIIFYNDQGIILPSAQIATADLLSYYAPQTLQLNWDLSKKQAIKLYEHAYKQDSTLKNDKSYSTYLSLLYGFNKDEMKPILLKYAKEMDSSTNDDQKWINARKIYDLLRMFDDKQRVEEKIVKKNPYGEWAIRRFWNDFYSKENHTELSVLSAMDNYIKHFKDSSVEVKDRFYTGLIYYALNKGDFNIINKYEKLIKNKLLLSEYYNGFAWKSSGEELSNTGTDLKEAKILSSKSIEYIKKRISQLEENDGLRTQLRETCNTYLNTFALILYKLNQYDSAFYYQNAIFKQGGALDIEGLERYAVYAEKVKGANFARQIIEEQLLSGVKSPIMLAQLQSIYEKLHLPKDELGRVQKRIDQISREKTAKEIKARLGTLTAKDFTLKNILGQDVSLSSFKGKIVVLDFWATWCGPCIASFPAMQNAINKYKGDSTVVFLFIDVWETKSPEEAKEDAVKFLKEHNYNFNVLFDIKNEVTDNYRVHAIPAKFIIDKSGNIVFMGETSNILLEIENIKRQN